MEIFKKKVKENWFVRILIIVFCIFIIVMISFSYFLIEPKGQLNSGIISLLLILLVLVLSESFDNFSVGKLVSITRKVNKKEEIVQKLEKEKSQLLTQLITVSTSQNQTQQHTNLFGDYNPHSATVERASNQEIQAETSGEEKVCEVTPTPERRINPKKLEEIAMQKYISKTNIHSHNVISDAKLTTQFHGIDPVSNQQPIFDGYYKNDNKEIFVEFRKNGRMSFFYRDRLYLMLSKLNHYKNIKSIDTHLDLVFIDIPDENPDDQSITRFKEYFEPAIISGLLRISEVNITKEEIENIKY